jgi:hypothetical protein
MNYVKNEKNDPQNAVKLSEKSGNEALRISRKTDYI